MTERTRTEREWEFVTLDGEVVATYDGVEEKLAEAADATATFLGRVLTVRELLDPPETDRRGPGYLLVVLTHGQSQHLTRVLDSFCAHVTPEPTEVLVWVDGPDREDAAYDAVCGRGWDFTLAGGFDQQGFCAAVGEAWDEAAATDYDYVFWLENDFVFVRDVDLSNIARVLEAEPQLAQMALYRQSVNADERAAGGYLRQHAAAYTERTTYVGSTSYRWMETTRNWTTNPSLFRRSVAAENPWPVAEHCEGVFGFQVRERHPETKFGIWGVGRVDVEHIGERDGTGTGY